MNPSSDNRGMPKTIRQKIEFSPDRMRLYAEFGEDDTLLAEEGMKDYAIGLDREDNQ
jgi:hypothetical protein